jgi:hypothetical protein
MWRLWWRIVILTCAMPETIDLLRAEQSIE